MLTHHRDEPSSLRLAMVVLFPEILSTVCSQVNPRLRSVGLYSFAPFQLSNVQNGPKLQNTSEFCKMYL